ncbi:hypothetical protein [Halorhabdus salina]|uniref:hypothetical protein n=1 Tax=Halorhabdus salina TaxID=2750670 RepID=UPI0015EE752E|nr:hypothetical protein [Halorhabdus salina]
MTTADLPTVGVDTIPEIVVEPDETARQLREYVRDHPEVRHEDYRDAEDPLTESCYVLAEAYFHAQGGEDSDLEVYRLDWGEVYDDAEGAHWFLREGETIVDLSLPTPEDGHGLPWDLARHRAFITGYEPSNRTARVLEALGLDGGDRE